jgi:CHASE domain
MSAAAQDAVEEKKEDPSSSGPPGGDDGDDDTDENHPLVEPARARISSPTTAAESSSLPSQPPAHKKAAPSRSFVMDSDASSHSNRSLNCDGIDDEDSRASPGRTNQLLSMMLHNRMRRSHQGSAETGGAAALLPPLNLSEGESSCEPSAKQPLLGEQSALAARHCHLPAGDGGGGSGGGGGGIIMPAWMVTLLIVSVGVVASAGFLGMGIRSSYREQYDQFERSADDTVLRFQSAFQIYLSTASFIHNRCRNRNFSREDFRQLYEYVRASGLAFQAIQFDPRISRHERADAESEARQYYAQHYPHVPYVGFRGVAHDNTNVTYRQAEADFYYPVHYMEPVVGNEGAIGLDYHSSPSRLSTVEDCLRTGRPALTDRLRLIQQEEMVYGVVLMHPGVKLSAHHHRGGSSSSSLTGDDSTVDDDDDDETWPRDISSIVIRIPDLIGLAMGNQGGDSAAYLFDPTISDQNHAGEPLFLGGVRVSASSSHPTNSSTTTSSSNKPEQQHQRKLTFIPETRLSQVTKQHRYYKMVNVSAANKVWTVVVVAVDGTFRPRLVFVFLSSAMILLASAGLAYWNYSYTERVLKFNAIRAAAEAEKQALILESARQAAVAERELNDFIACVNMTCILFRFVIPTLLTCISSLATSLSVSPMQPRGPEPGRRRHVGVQLRQARRERPEPALDRRGPQQRQGRRRGHLERAALRPRPAAEHAGHPPRRQQGPGRPLKADRSAQGRAGAGGGDAAPAPEPDPVPDGVPRELAREHGPPPAEADRAEPEPQLEQVRRRGVHTAAGDGGGRAGGAGRGRFRAGHPVEQAIEALLQVPGEPRHSQPGDGAC